MNPVLYIQSGTKGLLYVNGLFCGPLDAEGQAFPAGGDAQAYVQLFPFGCAQPLAVQIGLRGGQVERLEPQENAFALSWPDGVIQLELRTGEESAQERGEEQTAVNTLMRYLLLRLAGDGRAASLLAAQASEPPIEAYDAVVPLRFAPPYAGGTFDERAGLVKRTLPNAAQVHAVLARTSPSAHGMRRIEKLEIRGG